MKTFTDQRTISSVSRLTYSGTPSVGTNSVVYTNLKGYLRPLSEEQSSMNSIQWGFGFQLITEVGIDIQIGDTLTIESNLYTVRGLAVHDRGGTTAYQKYLLVKKPQ